MQPGTEYRVTRGADVVETFDTGDPIADCAHAEYSCLIRNLAAQAAQDGNAPTGEVFEVKAHDYEYADE